MNVAVQTDEVETKHFSCQTEEEKGKWHDYEKDVEIIEEANKPADENSMFICRTRPDKSGNKMKHQSTQTAKINKDKAIQTDWIVHRIEIDESRLQGYEIYLHHLARHQFLLKWNKEFEAPPILTDIEENSTNKIGEKIEGWKTWKVGEFHWDEENNNDEKLKEGGQRKGKSWSGGELKIDYENKQKQGGSIKTFKGLTKKQIRTNEKQKESKNKKKRKKFKKKGKRNLKAELMKRRRMEREKWSVHLGNHWCLEVINLKRKEIAYFDSLMKDNPQYLRSMMQYLMIEAKNKKEKEIDEQQWTMITRKDIPKQENTHDCGVFVCAFARCAAFNQEIRFRQEDIPEMRDKIIRELQEGKLL
ncbi:uncharacterized protein [Venturia canescens]|uniref:uncharacterized protein n=1 Tax=Venturia canescens TaxID=32260 RepID=UPI001C9D2E6E|nr:uncharacterized protein LOC122414846 [Venturia canescens]